MEVKNPWLDSQHDLYKQEANNSFSQYLSFRFYKENLDHLSDITKDSINNFLKSITEIEEDFLNMLQSQRMKNLELHDFGFEVEVTDYMEENY
jgi:hypothetical protein